MLELSISICILLILIGTFVSYNRGYLNKALKVMSVSYLSPVIAKDVVEHALTGRWSNQYQTASDIMASNQSERIRVEGVRSNDGNYVITYVMASGDVYDESYRLTYKDSRLPTLYWTCGNAKPRDDEVIPMINQTNTSKRLLTHLCR